MYETFMFSEYLNSRLTILNVYINSTKCLFLF